MKTLIPIITLLFATQIFTSNSYAEWTKYGNDIEGYTFYVDFNTMRKKNDNVYIWTLVDFPRPNTKNESSATTLLQADCELFRYKLLSQSYFRESKGKGKKTRIENSNNPKWKFAEPNTLNYLTLELVCNK